MSDKRQKQLGRVTRLSGICLKSASSSSSNSSSSSSVVVVVVKVTVGVVIVVAVAEAVAVAAAPELSAVAEPRLGDTDQRARQAGQASQAGSAPEVRCAQDCGKAFELVSPSLRASTSAKAPPAKLYIASEGGLPLMTK
ncbi:hypothetical protein HZH68_008187 [Vespula germanica]|uniref:Uncharacterized protein n=1 Tax=Vespula germanica TaxID=30212 RepID=A0A834K4A5_VESGE|nr:hypothetical protein HZH68_008187 [Vespula germanica]